MTFVPIKNAVAIAVYVQLLKVCFENTLEYQTPVVKVIS